jgi:hypothetical protein
VEAAGTYVFRAFIYAEGEAGDFFQGIGSEF